MTIKEIREHSGLSQGEFCSGTGSRKGPCAIGKAEKESHHYTC